MTEEYNHKIHKNFRIIIDGQYPENNFTVDNAIKNVVKEALDEIDFYSDHIRILRIKN